MNLNSLSGSNWFQQLETKFMTGLQSTTAAAGNAASASANSAASATGAAATAAVTAAPATPSNQFAPDVLSALISAQAGPPTSSQVAQGLISTLDSNGDGSLSLSEITNALNGSGGTSGSSQTSGTSSGLSAAFGKIDTNGDGQLSADELASALTTAAQDAQNGQGPQGAHGHHHHHHHGGGAAPANQNTATSTTTSTTTDTTITSMDVTTGAPVSAAA